MAAWRLNQFLSLLDRRNQDLPAALAAVLLFALPFLDWFFLMSSAALKHISRTMFHISCSQYFFIKPFFKSLSSCTRNWQMFKICQSIFSIICTDIKYWVNWFLNIRSKLQNEHHEVKVSGTNQGLNSDHLTTQPGTTTVQCALVLFPSMSIFGLLVQTL